MKSHLYSKANSRLARLILLMRKRKNHKRTQAHSDWRRACRRSMQAIACFPWKNQTLRPLTHYPTKQTTIGPIEICKNQFTRKQSIMRMLILIIFKINLMIRCHHKKKHKNRYSLSRAAS